MHLGSLRIWKRLSENSIKALVARHLGKSVSKIIFRFKMGRCSSAHAILAIHTCNVRFTVEPMETKNSSIGTKISSPLETEIGLILPHSDCFGTLVAMRNVCLISVPFWVVLAEVIHTFHFMFHLLR
jgi:hypothetical protein